MIERHPPPTGSAEIVYDITRLVTRALNPAPNGIDRIDFALARHYLAPTNATNRALICTLLGPRLAERAAALQSVDEIENHWNEFIDPASDPIYESTLEALRGPSRREKRQRRILRPRDAKLFAQNWRAMKRWAFHAGRSLDETPQGAVYFNASQFLLDKPWFVGWLDRRKDVKPVFYVHDLLPIDFPEFFWPKEPEAHERRMRNICRFAAGVVTGSHAVARRLEAFAAAEGRESLPICVVRPPASPAFATERAPDPRLDDLDYFVVCGTIEPRKNLLMLLNLWRELAAAVRPPKLVLVGKRGWLSGSVLDLLERSAAIRANVVEVGGLSTPGLRRLLGGARALLAPSFAEGFGIPLAEAMTAGVPVIASDIEVFREVGGDALDYVDPLDGLGWLRAVQDYAAPDSARRQAAIDRLTQRKTSESPSFLSDIEVFVASIAR